MQSKIEALALWLAAGARIVWELNSETRELTVHRPDAPPRVLGPDDALSGEEVLPGFTYPLKRLFRSSLPRQEKEV